MESFEDSNCHSLSDSFSLYERYLRSFNVVDTFIEDKCEPDQPTNCEYDSSNEGNIDLTATNVVNKHCETAENDCNPINLVAENVDKSLDTDLGAKEPDLCVFPTSSLLDNLSATLEHSLLTDKSDATDVPVSSDDSKSNCFKHPFFITSNMENSNNAVDSVPLFRDVRPAGSVFKLPISELSFNGTIKHVQRLKPMIDPITTLTLSSGLVNLEEKSSEKFLETFNGSDIGIEGEHKACSFEKVSDTSNCSSETNRVEKVNESTGDSQYEEFIQKKEQVDNEDGKWNLEQSYSSLEASFDSGVRSPDIFSEEDDADPTSAPEPFWGFQKEFEARDKKRIKKLEETLQGVLPPPSVTILKTDVTEMLKKYYSSLPAFKDNAEVTAQDGNPETPIKRVSFIQIPMESEQSAFLQEPIDAKCNMSEKENVKRNSISNDGVIPESDTSADKSIQFKMSTEIEAKETSWPNILKCQFYDVYYNVTHYSEKFEMLTQKYGERYVGAETETSVNVYSGGMQSPSSASKRKAFRLKMAQGKSPGRRLSHLARRRQAFCSAATINEKALASNTKMVFIDKNFFPHRKLINSAERKSPRTRRSPGKRTPIRRTPGKKTPAKTPKSGSSQKKKAMRRLLMDSNQITRSQPREAMIKRALFISPENRKTVPQIPSSSVPLQAMKSKRALFGSPVTAETKSMDGSQSDLFLKRKLDALDDKPETSRSKIAKSLSFGGDTIGTSHSQPVCFSRRASEVFAAKNSVELNETHKKKLLWAVSEALRVHGWRMSSPGFREKASALARLTRRLLALPPHAARLASPKLSTSETMLKLARQYVFAIIQGRAVEDCFQEEQAKLSNEANTKVTGYISATAYQQLKARQASTSTFTSQIKENVDGSVKQEQPRSTSKNILQDKLVNIDTNSNSNSSSSGVSLIAGTALFKSNSMPSFEEAAKMRARRQISFDNVEFPKR